MAKFPKQTQIATAVTKHSKLDLSSTHVTTGNFMDFQVCKYMELVPSQKVNIFHNVFARMDPLNVPTYGDCSIHNRAFFVPYRTIFRAWNDFITDSVHTYSDGVSLIPTNVPLIANSTLVNLFITKQAFATESANGSELSDFTAVSPGGSSLNFNLTPMGARFFKLLYSLGYRIDFNLRNDEDYYSALPLLAAAKVYYDWYYPTAYIQDYGATRALNWFNYDNGRTGQEFHIKFDENELEAFALFMDKVNYDSDYFTSAWDNPSGPNNNASSQVQLSDITLPYNDVNVVSNPDGTPGAVPLTGGTPYIDLESAGRGTLSQFALNALRSLSDYLKRHQLAGSRALDRYLARFGVALSAEKLNRSYYISEFKNNQPIQFGDVTATSDTSSIGGDPLGAYAGKGISAGKGNSFEFETDEYGMLIIVSTIIPRVTYTQGQDRITMHRTRLDFHTPEFDNVGVQAIATKELIVPLHGNQSGSTGVDFANLTFGFNGRYSEYKRAVDQVTGDYILNSRNTLLDSWIMNRNILPMVTELGGVQNLKHSVDMLRGDDSQQYNRIFQYTDESRDHFYILHQFNISTMFPGSSLFDTYEFENEDKAKKVTIDVNGVKQN